MREKNYLFILLFISSLLILNCGNRENRNKQNVIEERGTIQSELLQMFYKSDSLYKNELPDLQLMNNFIDQVSDFVEKYPEDAISPDLLFKAGVFSMILTQLSEDKVDIAKYARQTINIFNKIEKIYPEYENVKNCYLFRGQVYEILKDYRSAEIEYQDLLHKFPSDSITTAAMRAYIENLGKPVDEILVSLENKKY